jgi:protein-S-isoprenylcysteine O-methyltransferase Ste14
MPPAPAQAALPPPLLYLAFIAVAIALSYALPVPLPANSWTAALAVALIILGQGLSFWAMLLFKRQHTATSNFDAPKQLLREGPFAISRNPINLGDTAAYAGLALLMGSLWPWLLLPVLLYLMNWLVIRPDEIQLEALFGDTYRQYCRRVRRWL